MFGWVGELAHAFASIGPWGVVLLTMLIIIILLIRQNARMHSETVAALDRSSQSHNGVARVLGRIEGILGIGGEDE